MSIIMANSTTVYTLIAEPFTPEIDIMDSFSSTFGDVAAVLYTYWMSTSFWATIFAVTWLVSPHAKFSVFLSFFFFFLA